MTVSRHDPRQTVGRALGLAHDRTIGPTHDRSIGTQLTHDGKKESTMSERADSDRPSESEKDMAERLGRTLDGWRGRIDELLVQLDLAGLEVRDEVRSRIDVTENIYLAARSRLSEVKRDAGASVSSICEASEKLVRDLKNAYEAAEAALHRTPAR